MDCGAAVGFEICAHERLHEGFIKLDRYQVRQRRFDGRMTPLLDREVLVANAAVAVLCYDPLLDAIVLVQQLRLPALLAGFDAMTTEIVAGLIDPGGDPLNDARREVLEETGLEPVGDLIPIVHMLTTPGHSTEHVRLYCARVDAAGSAGQLHGKPEENEDIRLVLVPVAEIRDWIADGRLANSFTLVACHWLFAERDRLRRLWGVEDRA